METFFSWLKEEGKASLILGVFGLIVTVIFSISNCALEKSRQSHEIRIKYLDLALAERKDPYEKERVLRFLVDEQDDIAIKKWAQSGLDIIQKAKEAEKNKEYLELKANRQRDSILIAREKKLEAKAKDFEKQRKQTLQKVDSVKREIRRLEKSVSVVSPQTNILIDENLISTFTSVDSTDIHCKNETIRTNAMEIAAMHSCVLSSSSQDKRREGNKLIWRAPFFPGMSFAAPATCYCEIE